MKKTVGDFYGVTYGHQFDIGRHSDTSSSTLMHGLTADDLVDLQYLISRLLKEVEPCHVDLVRPNEEAQARVVSQMRPRDGCPHRAHLNNYVDQVCPDCGERFKWPVMEDG